MRYFLCYVCLIFFCHQADAACTVTDDQGHSIRLVQPAQRIISLAPDITEILFAIGAGAHLKGVVSGSDYPAEAKNISVVGSYRGIDLERIIALSPDLIVTWDHTFSRQLAVLKSKGIPIYVTQPRQLEDVPRTMKNLGCLTGTKKIADYQADLFSKRLVALTKHYHQKSPVTVFYQIEGYSLFTVNKDSWINQVMTLCGGRNVFAHALSIAPEVSWEAVVAANPQAIISGELNPHWKKRWAAWPVISAVKNGFLFTIPADLMARAGPRLIDGATQLCQDLEKVRQSPLLSA